MINLFASDLDGTILNEEHKCDETIADTLHVIHAAKRVFATATGRNLHMIHECGISDIIPTYKIALNGAAIYDPKDRLLASSSIDKKAIKALISLYPAVRPEFITKDGILVLDKQEEHIRSFEGRLLWQKKMKEDPSFLPYLFSYYTFSCTEEFLLQSDILKIDCNVYEDSVTALMDTFVQQHGDTIVNAASRKGFYEITEKHTNKAEGVKKLCELLEIPYQEAAVFGDGGNDLEMLSFFEHSYAVDNASAIVKEKAHHVIAGNTSYGVCRKIKELL